MSRYTEFRDVQKSLTDDDIDQLVDIIGSKCRHATKVRIRSVLTYGPSTIPDFGIMRRLIKDEGTGKWQYVAGQSYPDEIRVVRNIITTGKA